MRTPCHVWLLADPGLQMHIADLDLKFRRLNEQTAQAISAFQKAEIEKWWPIIGAPGVRAE